MPVDKQVYTRYHVLNKCFRDLYNDYTIDDLVDECNKALRRDNKPNVSKRTIQNDITTLETDYGIHLDENIKSGKKRLYRYYDTSYSLPLFEMDDTDRNKIQAAVNVLEYYEGEPVLDWARTLLMQIESGVFGSDSSSVVSFQSNPDLKGISLFGDLLKAIINKKVLKLTYAPFGKNSFSKRIYPYYLKQFNDRWYLIAQAVGYESMSNYALDRIENFEEIDLDYKDSDVDFEDYFDDVIGVTVSGGEPEDIIIKVYKESLAYIKTKPLHLSQRYIEDTGDYAVICINVKPNYELDSRILSFGPSVEILAPDNYRQHIADRIRAMNKKYSNDAKKLHT